MRPLSRRVVIPAAAVVVLIAPEREVAGPRVQARIAQPSPSAVIEARFDWTMPDRYGLDRNRNEIIDIPNTAEYVHNLAPGACGGAGCRQRVAEFDVRFDARTSHIPRLAPVAGFQAATAYEWMVSGGILPQSRNATSPSPVWSVRLPEGRYDVRLIVTSGLVPTARVVGGVQPKIEVRQADTVTQRVTVEDILIVAMGDSYTSGEGNPEMRQVTVTPEGARHQVYWADDGASTQSGFTTWKFDRPASGMVLIPGVESFASTANGQNHLRAHRSSRAATSQVALEIERADPKTSVTYISVAASGAKASALYYGYKGLDSEPYATRAPMMKAQISEVAELVGQRQIDALIMSVGVNDIGFAPVLTALVIHSRVMGVRIAEIESALKSGRWSWLEDRLLPFPDMRKWISLHFATDQYSPVGWRTLPGLDDLPNEYRKVSDKIRAESLKVFRTYITEYPDPTGVLGDDGELYFCPEIFGQMFPTFEIDPGEQDFLVQKGLIPLNDSIRVAARRHGWAYVGGISERFAMGHGICAWAPYEPAGFPYPRRVSEPVVDAARLREPRMRWFRRAGESLDLQGPFSKEETTGTMHPNEFGHRAVAERILASLELPVAVPGIGWTDPHDQIAEARSLASVGDRDLLRLTSVQMFRLPTSRNETHRIAVVPARPDYLKPHIRLFDARGVEVAATRCVRGMPNRATADIACADAIGSPHLRGDTIVLEYRAAEPGVYYVGVSAFPNTAYDSETGNGDAGAPRGVGFGQYTLTVNHPPGRPDNTIATANLLPPDGVAAGYAIEDSLDVDMFRVQVPTAGAAWTITFRGDTASPVSVQADRAPAVPTQRASIGQPASGRPGAAIQGLAAPTRRLSTVLAMFGKPLRPQLRVFDAQGNKLAQATDSLAHTFSAAGVYYVGVSSAGVDYAPSVGIGSVDCGATLPSVGRTRCTNPLLSMGKYTLTVRR